VPNDDIDNSKVVEDVHVPSNTAGIIEDVSVGSDTPIINKVHMCSDIPVMTWMR